MKNMHRNINYNVLPMWRLNAIQKLILVLPYKSAMVKLRNFVDNKKIIRNLSYILVMTLFKSNKEHAKN